MPVIIFSSIAAIILLLWGKKGTTTASTTKGTTTKGTTTSASLISAEAPDQQARPTTKGVSTIGTNVWWDWKSPSGQMIPPFAYKQPIISAKNLRFSFDSATKSGVSTLLQNKAPFTPMVQNRVKMPVNAGTSVGFVKFTPPAPSPLQHVGNVQSTITRGGRTFKSYL